MSNIVYSALKMLIKEPSLFIERLMYYLGTDKQYIKYKFKNNMGYFPNLKNPRTYNEKLQWLKLYDRKSIYTTMVDKYAVKKYVAERIGFQYIIPTLGVWDSFDEIDFDSLPNKFVLKCTHDSGGLVICNDKSKIDIEATKAKINNSISTNFYKQCREWPYKNVPRRIIAEEYMEDSKTKELRDYKFFCFDGNVKWLFIASDRQNHNEPYFDFFDDDFKHLSLKHGHPNAPVLPSKPLCFEEMKTIAKTLSMGFPHVRVDFYEVNGKVYFGEMTFFHHAGMVEFEPQEWDYIFGEMINLTITK